MRPLRNAFPATVVVPWDALALIVVVLPSGRPALIVLVRRSGLLAGVVVAPLWRRFALAVVAAGTAGGALARFRGALSGGAAQAAARLGRLGVVVGDPAIVAVSGIRALVHAYGDLRYRRPVI
ncbi:hypothetical protein [Sphaerisporangium dianthi]|uniref:Uncharacterized protein n=1 Tax=Sphaerisporangium dianthi TaxID=1436120 RepID=A0ABV9CWY6_9ACTN